MAFFHCMQKHLRISSLLILKKGLTYHKFNFVKVMITGNIALCHPIWSVIILVIKQIGLPLRGRPILLITRMITDRIGLHSVLLPLQIGRPEVLLLILLIITITKLVIF